MIYRSGFGALAALKRKRKKFSKSRNTSPIQEPAATPQISKSQKILTRASSVPSRHDESLAVHRPPPPTATAADASSAGRGTTTASSSSVSTIMAAGSSRHHPSSLVHQQQQQQPLQLPQHPPPSHHTIYMPPLPSTSTSSGGLIVRSISGLTASTTDESVKCSTSTTPPSSLSMQGDHRTAAGGLHVMSVDRSPPPAATVHHTRAGEVSVLPHLPNITPVRSHSSSYQGWL